MRSSTSRTAPQLQQAASEHTVEHIDVAANYDRNHFRYSHIQAPNVYQHQVGINGRGVPTKVEALPYSSLSREQQFLCRRAAAGFSMFITGAMCCSAIAATLRQFHLRA